jgi:hypothetical protein
VGNEVNQTAQQQSDQQTVGNEVNQTAQQQSDQQTVGTDVDQQADHIVQQHILEQISNKK